MHQQLAFAHNQYSKDPILSCALEGVANVIAGIQDVCLIIHSPQGCAATVGVGFDQHEIDFTKRKIGCTRLFETDIVMGAARKLEEVMKQAEKSFGAKVMFVAGTCAADIIGEDIEAVCRMLQPEMEAKLIPISAGGFRGNSYDGMNLGLEALLPFVKKTPIKMMDTVNIIAPQANANPTWYADLNWVKQILAQLDIGVQTIFSHDTTLAEIENAGRAAANLLMSHEVGYDFAKKMKEIYDIPLIMEDNPMPIGVHNTKKWLRALGAHFRKEEQIEKIILAEEKKLLDVLRKRGLMMIPRYRNCKLALSSDSTIGIGMIRMLFEELEMIPEAIIFKSCNEKAEQLLERELSDMNLSPTIVLNADGYQLKETIRQMDVDLVIGSAWEKYMAEELGIQVSFDVFEPTNRVTYVNEPYFGFEGMLQILQIFANDWERAFRSKEIKYKECN